MQTKALGKTGVQIPEIGIGTWHYHGGPDPLRAGLDAGARFIDTAESYGSEDTVGEALAGRRDEVFLATKVSRQHLRRGDVIRAAEASLRRLRTDRIDLYQIHEPNDGIPIEATMGAMEELADAGKVRFIGVSNFSLAQLQQAQRAMHRHPIVSNQVRFSLVDRTITAGLLPYCQNQHITVIAYSPLARSFPHIVECDPQGVLRRLAAATGHTPVQVALNWCLGHAGVVAIPKGNSVAHVRENCGASGWHLDAAQIEELDRLIHFRRRSGLELFLRRHFPPELKQRARAMTRFLPTSLRRRLG